MAKIVVAYHRYVPYTTGYYVEEAFRRLNQDVVYCEPTKIQQTDADLLFRVDDGTHTNTSSIEAFPRTAYWAIDTCANDGRTVAIGSSFDVVYEVNRHLVSRHANKGRWLPLAVPFSHLFTHAQKIEYDVALQGSPNEQRDVIVEAIRRELPEARIFYGRSSKEEIARIYQSSIIGLNITGVDTINMRTFEAANSFCLFQQRVGRDESGFDFLLPLIKAVRWSETSDLIDKIVWVLNNPEFYAETNAMNECSLHDHTYNDRMKQVIKDFEL